MTARRQLDIPLLEQHKAGGDDLSLPTNDTRLWFKSEIDIEIACHIRQRIVALLKWWGFRNSPFPIILLVISVLLTNLAVDGLTIRSSGYCLPLNVCVLIFQTESVVLFGFAFYSVTKSFIEKVVFQLTLIDITSPQYVQSVHAATQRLPVVCDDAEVIQSRHTSLLLPNDPDRDHEHKHTINRVYSAYKSHSKRRGITILRNEILKCLLLVTLSYFSGFLVFFIPREITVWTVYVYVSNVVDIIRYAPQILHIALARSYFQTFPIQLERVRNELGILSRDKELDDMQYPNELTLTVTHRRFIEVCERLIRPYRAQSSQLSEWILVYFVFNAAAFTAFLISIMSYWLGSGCGNEGGAGLYYAHYLIELWTFFAGWAFLVMPYCNNHNKLEQFFIDAKTMANTSPVEKCAIDHYIDSYAQRSPFSIYHVKPSYSRFMNLLYIVFATITLDVVTKVYNVDFL